MLFASNLFSLNSKGISVVIPNYNGIDLLPEILPPLYKALESTKLPYEVIISDDCSKDESVSFIKKNHPQVLLIENDINEGFSKTINKGIFKACYDFVLLLNSDVKISEDYFSSQLKYFEKEDTFGVMGRIIGWDDDEIQDGGKFPSFHFLKIKTSKNYVPIDEHANHWLPSFYLSGANAFVSREKLLALNGFDELYSPFYVEDVDLSLRAWRMGWKCYYEHNAVCRHKTSVTIKSKSSKKEIKAIYYRNKMFLHSFHLNGIRYFLWSLQNTAEVFIQTLLGKFTYLKAFQFYLANLYKLNFLKAIFNSDTKTKKMSLNEVVDFIFKELDSVKIRKF